MKLLLILSFILLPFALTAQDTVNELLDSLSLAEGENEKAKIQYRISLKYRDSDPKLAIKHAKKAATLAKTSENRKLLASAEGAIGTGHYALGDFENAMIFYFSSLRLREEIGDREGMSSSHNNIANIYNIRGDYNKGLSHYQKALKLGDQQENPSGYSSTLINIGNIFLAQEKYDRALVYYQKSLPIKERLGEKEGLVICYINMGLVYTGKKNYSLSIYYYNKALPVAEEIGSVIDKLYALRGKADAHLKSKQYNKAIINATESLNLAVQSNGKDEIRQCAKVLNNIYEATGNYAKAHEYLSLYAIYNDSITNEQVTDQIAELQVKYDTEKKAKDNLSLVTNHKLHDEEQKQRSLLQYLTIAMVVSVCFVAYVLFKGRQRLNRIHNELVDKNFKVTDTNNALNAQQHVLLRQADQLQEQKEELQKLNSIKDRLFSVIAHDLRGPLVSLKGLLQVMSRGGLPEQKQEELFNSLVKGQQNVLWMLDNLFDWARAQMKGFEVEKKVLDIKTLTDENIRLLLPIAISKAIRIENRIPEDTFVYGDSEMIKLVLRNLISNAIKFCSAGDLVVLSAFALDNICTVTVQDTGTGMSDDVQQKLFGRSGYTTRGTANEKGSGLGLALCKDFITQNGGTIWAESTLGEGSAFKFTLPVQSLITQDQLLIEPTLATVAV